jgi:hypothetical protein
MKKGLCTIAFLVTWIATILAFTVVALQIRSLRITDRNTVDVNVQQARDIGRLEDLRGQSQ